MYASDLCNIRGSFPSISRLALIPAISPCAAASSYPEVPFVCPAKNIPFIFFNSNDNFNCEGSMQSYSIAYAGLVNSTFSNPGIVLYIAICTSSGRDELIPCTYISSVSNPIGSINI